MADLVNLIPSFVPNRRKSAVKIDRLRESFGGHFPDFLKVDFLKELAVLFSYSDFMANFFIKHPELIKDLKDLYSARYSIRASLPRVEGIDEETLSRKLTVFKNFHMACVILKDILGIEPLVNLMRDVTIIHDAILGVAYMYSYNLMVERYGKPVDATYCVLDMGKAGGFELNYASDVDVMFIYSSRYGMTTGGKFGRISNHDFFVLLSEKIVEILTRRTEEGVCLNIDLRLRPNGSMGPICNDFEALENYYTAVARPWERFALLKARPCAGDLSGTGIEFLKLANQFVYRRYIDLTLIEEVLRLKELIKSQVVRKGSKIDLKLGRGGIREIEFIVQAFQIIYGGKNPRICSRHTIKALEKLRRWGFLNANEYMQLLDAYVFLRRAEHMLQITNFRQTQTFHPESEEAEELALKMGFRDRESFLSVLKKKMDGVSALFGKFFPTGKVLTFSSVTVDFLRSKGVDDPEDVKRFFDSLIGLKTLAPEEQNRIDVSAGRLIDIMLGMPDVQMCVKNLLRFLENEVGKVFFFSVLSEINTLKLLLSLIGLKSFFMEHFIETPEVLDFLFDPEGIEKPRTYGEVNKTIGFFKNLKLAKNLEELRILLRYMLGHCDVVRFMDELTAVTDAVVSSVYEEGWPFSVFALGKYGSREMNVGSDLDLILVSSGKTDEKSNNRAVEFINRLKKYGYDVDTRLRPFGEKGELVFTVDYFGRYVRQSARVWERLAFTRLRFVVGDDSVRRLMEREVDRFLFGSRLSNDVFSDVLLMRERLEKELATGEEVIKYGAGGIVDLEFIGYMYQLLTGRKIGNVYKVLVAIASDYGQFSDLPLLYRRLMEADTERRLYGKFVGYVSALSDLRREVRTLYKEFVKWIKNSLSMQKL